MPVIIVLAKQKAKEKVRKNSKNLRIAKGGHQDTLPGAVVAASGNVEHVNRDEICTPGQSSAVASMSQANANDAGREQ